MNAAQPPAANIAAPGGLPGGLPGILLENAAAGPGVIDAPAITAANATIPGIPAATAIPAAYHPHAAAAKPDAANAAIPRIPAAAAFPAAYHTYAAAKPDAAYAAIPSVPAAYHANAAIPGIPADAAMPDADNAAIPGIPALPAMSLAAVYHAADSAIPADPAVTQGGALGTAVDAAAIPANVPLRPVAALMAAAR